MTTTAKRQLPFAQLLLGLAALALFAGVLPAQQAGALLLYAIAIAIGAGLIIALFLSRPRLDRFNTKAQSGFGLATCVLALIAGLALIGSTLTSSI